MHKNLLLKVLALAIACFFWLQSALLKQHQTTVRFPLIVTNLSHEVVLPKLPSQIPFVVSGFGYEILKLKLFHVTVEVDARDLTKETAAFSLSEYKINLPPSIRVDILGPVSEADVTVQSEVARKYTLPVQIIFEDADTRALFYEMNYQLQPDNVEVTGSERILKNLRFIPTRILKRTMLTQSKFRLKLNPPSGDVSLSEEWIELSQSPEQFVSRVIQQLPVKAEAGIDFYPQSVTIRIRGLSRRIQSLDTRQIEVQLNTADEKYGEIPLRIKLPAGVELLEYTPEKVKRTN